MDEHKEKEEDKFQESSEQQQPRKQEAEEEDNSEESMDQHQAEGYKEGINAEEEPTMQLKEVETTGSEEASSSPSVFSIFAHPCSLLQYLLRACAAWCWVPLHGAFDDGPKPQAQATAAPEAVAPANSTEQGDGGGEKANYFYMQEVVTRVRAVRRGRPPGGPGHPREGRGGSGGIHH